MTRRARHGLCRRHLRRPHAVERCPASCHRPHPLFDRRREPLANAQPFLIDCVHGQMPICHNGNLVNAGEIRVDLVREGLDLPDQQRHRGRAASVRAIAGGARTSRPLIESLAQVQRRVLVRHADAGPADRRARSARLPSARARPARRRLGRLLRDLRARPDRRHLRARRRARRGAGHQRRRAALASSRFPRRALAHCVFEHVYFARPDSYVFGQSVNEVRTELGRVLAREVAGRRRRRRARSPTRASARPSASPRSRASRCGWA